MATYRVKYSGELWIEAESESEAIDRYYEKDDLEKAENLAEVWIEGTLKPMEPKPNLQ